MHKGYIGWDVGGWDCERNANSRDAVVILGDSGEMLGTAWRGNLREVIRQSETASEWVGGIAQLCGVSWPAEKQAVIAIDASLGFPVALLRLCQGKPVQDEGWRSAANPYLFREAERYLHRKGFRPMSPVKDMIGSQSAKVLHALHRFKFRNRPGGIWTAAGGLQALETYPAACRQAPAVLDVLSRSEKQADADKEDARVCAAVAWLASNQPEELVAPPEGLDQAEGWIWHPRRADAL